MISHLNHKQLDPEEEKKIDALLRELQTSSLRTTRSPADEFFEELVDMLQQPEKELPLNTSQSETNSDEDLFDQIIREIPPHQLPALRRSKTASEIQDEIVRIEQELETNYKRNAYLHKMRDEFMSQPYIDHHLKQRSGIDKQNESDHHRIDHHYQTIKLLVGQLSIFSSARKTYMQIINHRELDHYEKVQRLIESAQRILMDRKRRKIGFFSRHLRKKSLLIHETIAGIDVNRDDVDAITNRR